MHTGPGMVNKYNDKLQEIKVKSKHAGRTKRNKTNTHLFGVVTNMGLSLTKGVITPTVNNISVFFLSGSIDTSIHD